MPSTRFAQKWKFVPVFVLALCVTKIDAVEHVVAPSDTLFGLALQYDIPVTWIIRSNNLSDDSIRVGEILDIPSNGIRSLEVRPGDTLSGLSVEFDIPVEDLRAVNALETDLLTVGQKLVIPPPTPRGTHRVVSGESLLSIANQYDISLEALKTINGLDSDVIYPNQLLIVLPPRPEGHEVIPGESLWSIANRYGISMNDLKTWNHLQRDVIHPGEMLVLYQGLEKSSIKSPSAGVALASLPQKNPEELRARTNINLPSFGEYFYSAPTATRQPNEEYWESSDASPLVDYNRAREVLKAFDAEIAAEGAAGSRLKGYQIILDPGHGGLDPGAIVSVEDGNGNPVVITEDEYAYDVAIRLYRILRRNGALVSLTILAPDHDVRDGMNARETFVNRKNEVYNNEAHNRNAAWRPVGGIEGLDLRKGIASGIITSTSASLRRKGTIFVSIHADNTSEFPAGTAVLFDGEDERELAASQKLAEAMAPSLGTGSFTHRQQLRVLRGNPADAAVLVEARNIYYPRNAWALRSADLREQDARMIADGILAWVDAR